MPNLNERIPGKIFTGWDVLGIVYGTTAFFAAPIIGGLLYGESWEIGAWIKVVFFTTGSLWMTITVCKLVLPANSRPALGGSLNKRFDIIKTPYSSKTSIIIGLLIGLLLSAATLWRPAMDLYQGPITKEGFLIFEYGRGNKIDVLSFTDKKGKKYKIQETPTRSTEWLLEQEYCGRKAIEMTFLEYRKLRPVLSAKCRETENFDYGP